MVVFVMNRQGEAKVVNRTPFPIKLLHRSSGYRQSITLVAVSGYTYISLSAVSNKAELVAGDVTLRSDIVKLNSERSTHWLNRRNRQAWYRQPRFLNSKKGEVWLAPSIQHKLDSHVNIIQKTADMPHIKEVITGVAAFHIHRITNPVIEGIDYQDGNEKDFWNVREYIHHHDGHTCRHCKGKSKDHMLEVHPVESRQTGGDRPQNPVIVCSPCHDHVSKYNIIIKANKSSKGFTTETFMSTVRWKLLSQLERSAPIPVGVENTEYPHRIIS